MPNRIRDIRRRLALTQVELAFALRISQPTVAKMEAPDGNVKPETASRLVHYARERGLALTLDMVYGLEYLPAAAPTVLQTAEPTGKG